MVTNRTIFKIQHTYIHTHTSNISTPTISTQYISKHPHYTHILPIHFYLYTSTYTSLKQHLTKHILKYLHTHILEQTYTYPWPNLHLNTNKQNQYHKHTLDLYHSILNQTYTYIPKSLIHILILHKSDTYNTSVKLYLDMSKGILIHV